MEVFHRGPSFDPKSDTIVRVQARNLRQRLAEYYAAGGSSESLAIELPKGGYLPIFRKAKVGSLASAHRNRRWTTVGIVSAAAIGTAAMVIFVAGGRRERKAAETVRCSSIAVFRLENLTRESSKEYLADGLTDQVLTQLSKLRGVQIIWVRLL